MFSREKYGLAGYNLVSHQVFIFLAKISTDILIV